MIRYKNITVTQNTTDLNFYVFKFVINRIFLYLWVKFIFILFNKIIGSITNNLWFLGYVILYTNWISMYNIVLITIFNIDQ